MNQTISFGVFDVGVRSIIDITSRRLQSGHEINNEKD